MAGGSDEVQTCVHTQVGLVFAIRLLFLTHICFVLVVNKFHDGCPRIAVVDVVSKARGIDDGELDLELLLLELGLDDFNLGQLVHLLVESSCVVLGWRKFG